MTYHRIIVNTEKLEVNHSNILDSTPVENTIQILTTYDMRTNQKRISTDILSILLFPSSFHVLYTR